MGANSPGTSRLDGSEALENLLLPYDKQTKELDDAPRLVDGSDVWVDLGGSIAKRPAVRDSDLGGQTVPATSRLERVWVYKTLETPAKVYLLGSWKNTGTNKYAMYYIRIGTTAAWTSVGTTREVDNSDRQHEVTIANGKAYIKSFPAGGTGEFLGTTVFDGTDASLHYWGLLGPTQAQAAALTASGGWTATTNVDVQFGWKYAYSWKTSTGQISSRSPLKIAAGQGQLSGSDTGAFSNLKPTVTVQGDAATSLIPNIIVWRTLDGGGVFPNLQEIVNTGAGGINYEDNDSAGTAGQPKVDGELDTADLAPFTTVNSPPPAVIAPGVTGVDPIEATSNIVEFAGRIWYAIGNILMFSGNEEISNGIPQESFPTGLRGNFLRFKNPVRLLGSTSEAIYVITDETVLWGRGSNRQSFFFEPLFKSIGGAEGQNNAVTEARDFVAFLTDDNEIAMIRGNNLQIISGPLKDDISSRINANTEIQLESHFFEGRGWIVVGLRDNATPANSRVWVYDLNRGAWNPPWVIPFSAMVSGRVRESDQKRELVIATQNATGARVGAIDFAAFTDQYNGGTSEYAPSLTTNLFKIPAGNHTNLLSRKGSKPTLRNLIVERTKYGGDTDPTVEYRLDEFTGAFLTPAKGPSIPTPTAQHTSYSELWYDIGSMGSRAQLKVSKAANAEQMQIQTLAFLWDQPGGAG